jgi:hypothetical protein
MWYRRARVLLKKQGILVLDAFEGQSVLDARSVNGY